ncbi:hypothetical protein ACU8V7_16575 [Zobellia nedashkovskayae]
MEFAPDGSLYFLDWSNVLIGHMQHNARDPLRIMFMEEYIELHTLLDHWLNLQKLPTQLLKNY